MTCPHCNKELDIEPNVYRNVETYGKGAVATTNCCGRGVFVFGEMNFGVRKYEGCNTEDDWGRPINSTPYTDANDSLGKIALDMVQNGEYTEVLKTIRALKNPLTAAWLATFLMVNAESNEFKNWLANATYNGV